LITSPGRKAAKMRPEAGVTETVEQVRKRGIARAEGDFMQGMSAFAAPVFDDRGRLVLSLTVLGYKAGFDHRWNSPVVAALREAASRLSHMLGYEQERLRKDPRNGQARKPG
jgi:DNA-binding IclR family transcriptional regulator